MEYTVNLLFDRRLDQVLLQKKSKTEFKDKLNGPGGKLEEGETPAECAVREIFEETGLTLVPEQLYWLGSLHLPHDCGTGKEELCILHFFCGIVEHPERVKTSAIEPLTWTSTERVADPRTQYPPLAGEGNLKYFINQALKLLGGIVYGAPRNIQQ